MQSDAKYVYFVYPSHTRRIPWHCTSRYAVLFQVCTRPHTFCAFADVFPISGVCIGVGISANSLI